MLSKSEMKDLKSLHQKKYREIKGLFLVEGDKSVREALKSSNEVLSVFAVDSWDRRDLSPDSDIELVLISQKQLSQICELKNPNGAAALLRIPEQKEREINLNEGWHIYLDRVRDPGNMGTILRIADWYGMAHIICSPDCVELYNQKVMQASMGAIFRIKAISMTETELIDKAKKSSSPLHATTMTGDSIYESPAGKKGVLMMGNEGGGLSDKLLQAADVNITIPGDGKAESLNVAVSTGILSDWIFRTKG